MGGLRDPCLIASSGTFTHSVWDGTVSDISMHLERGFIYGLLVIHETDYFGVHIVFFFGILRFASRIYALLTSRV